MYDMTGVILSGGRNIRMGGENKAFLEVGGKRVIDRTVELFGELFGQIILVTNQPLKYSSLDLEIVVDIFPQGGSLIGIYTGLFYSSSPRCFVAAGDMPFISKGVIEYMLGIKGDYDIVIPHLPDGYHPLLACYSRRCLGVMEELIRAERLKITGLFNKVKVREVMPGEITALDHAMRSFFNLNTPGDLEEARKQVLDDSDC